MGATCGAVNKYALAGVEAGGEAFIRSVSDPQRLIDSMSRSVSRDHFQIQPDIVNVAAFHCWREPELGVDWPNRPIAFGGDSLRPLPGEGVEGGDRPQALLVGAGQSPTRRAPLTMREEGAGRARPAGRDKRLARPSGASSVGAGWETPSGSARAANSTLLRCHRLAARQRCSIKGSARRGCAATWSEFYTKRWLTLRWRAIASRDKVRGRGMIRRGRKLIGEVVAVDTPKESALTPLLTDPQELNAAARKRKSGVNTKSVHPADVDALIAQGWSVRKAGKRKTILARDKPHDQSLEDRVWTLLRSMGYPRMNGSRFNIVFQRDDGSNGRKQIDVFASDSETALVVECKSRAARGRRSLQKDIQETISLKEYIRNAIYSSSKDRPKIVWLYATHNIIWSESDIARASDGGISIITENEIQYFEAFLKHMGPAGKYQILGEFLKGQKVPGLEGVRLPAVRGKIGGEQFYSFVATPRTLLRIAFVNHQALNHPDGKPAYQRMVSSSRIKEIGSYIKQGGYFPTNILVNFTVSPRFDLISNKENTDKNLKFGWITLPQIYRSAWIIDGQHRLYGYSHLDDEFLDDPLFVLAFDGMPTQKEADLFITINHKQKSVPKSLLVSLLADIRMGDSDPKTALSALASAVVRAINTDKTSPLSRRFSIPGVPPEVSQNLTISEAVNGLVRSELLGRVIGKVSVPGPLSGATDGETVDRARRVFNGYFEEIRKASPERWEAGRSAYVSTNPAIRAHFALVAEIIRYLAHKTDEDFHALSEDKLVSYVVEVASPVIGFIRSASDDEISKNFSRKFGEGGVREYYYNLLKIIHEEREDFGPHEFLTWVDQQESDRIDEANSFVLSLSELLTNHVIDTLKAIHGTHPLASGDPAFWEVGIESRRVKDNAYRKQQEDSAERRKPREAYLDIVDLEEIVKQKENWPHFEGVFSLPMPDEKHGKKFYLSWIARYNELRRIAAHKNNLRTYTEADLEFLDWLRSEISSRLPQAVR